MRFTPISFTCDGCGAPLKFSPATGNLTCEFCNRISRIETNHSPIQEYSLQTALTKLTDNRAKEITKEVTCPNCGTGFTLTPYSSSTNCPSCGTPTIVEFINEIKPESILPFVITQKEAKAIFGKWIGSLWFAPSELKRLVDTDKRLTGYYLPYWTYDADTQTQYQGQRGVVYYVTVQKRRVVNGREQIINTQEARVRWSHTSGRVSRYFDDVTIEASETLSRKILTALDPWDTSKLKVFNEKYLSGFESEEYSIGLDNGFEMAQVKMNTIIRHDIKRDIGGDRQQIDAMQIKYNNATFKNSLFPLWTTHFRYRGKDYHYAINGQSGEITGDRPYSYTKIAILVGVIALALFTGAFIDERFSDTFTTEIYYPR